MSERSSSSSSCLSDLRSPYTGYSWVIVLLSSVGFVLSIAPHGFCDFVYLKPIPNYIAAQEDIKIGLGLYQYEGFEENESGACFQYESSIEVDGLWQAARVFTILGCVLGGVSCAFYWFSGISHSSERDDKKRWMLIGVGSLLGSLFCGLSFLFFESSACDSTNWQSDGCELGPGGKFVIAGTVFLGASGIGTFIISSPVRLEQRPIPPTRAQELAPSTLSSV